MRNFWLWLIVAAASLWLWQGESRAALAQRALLRGLQVQLAPWGTLEYGATRAHFWGSGAIESLRFSLSPAASDTWGLPRGLVLTIPQLRYTEWQGHQRWPQKASLRLEHASIALPPPWPDHFAGRIDWDYRVETGQVSLNWLLDAPASGQLEGKLALQLDSPRTWSKAALTGGEWRYRDAGLAQTWRSERLLRSSASPQDTEQILSAELVAGCERYGLPPDAALRAELAGFARDPTAFTLRLDPPGRLRPEDLPLFAPADRIAALGLRLDVP